MHFTHTLSVIAIMKNKYYISLILLLSINVFGFSQVQTELQSQRIFDLSIVQVFPDSFPEIDVLFQAKDDAGRPLWGITKEELNVLEGGVSCKVLDLVNLSEGEVIDIAVVFDHSGSMGYPSIPDSMYNYDWTQTQIDSLMLLPKAIDFAKEGVLSFISSGALKQDSILIVGFSSKSDSIIGPTQNIGELESKVNSMNADFGTAFYDALETTLQHLSKKNTQKSAIVALTDGQDNESSKSVEEVIKMSEALDIPIYIIGLGNVQDSILKNIAQSTNGLYYKTDDPQRLREIYLNISRQLKSLYKLKYASAINGFAEDEQTLSIGFNNDTMTFSNPNVRLNLPKEVVSYIHQQETSRLEAIDRRNLTLGGTATGILAIGFTTFLLYRRKLKKKFQIIKVFPNPFTDKLTVLIEGSSPASDIQIEIVDLTGNQAHVQRITSASNTIELNLSHLPNGAFVISMRTLDGQIDSVKAIKK